MKITKKTLLWNMIRHGLHNNKNVATWTIEQMGKSIGIMGSTATRYAREFRERRLIKKDGLHTYRGGK